jgi:hypothetical protein
MRKPEVTYNLDKTITNFISKVVGQTGQDCIIWSEILVGAGLASRELTLLDSKLTLHFRASPDLKSRLDALQRDRGKKVD